MSASSGFAVLQALASLERSRTGPHRLRDISEHAGLRASQTSKILTQAIDHNLVTRVGYGRYQLTQGEAAVIVTESHADERLPEMSRLVNAFTDLHRKLPGHVVALHRPYYLPAKWLLCALMSLAAPQAYAAEALSWQGQQHPAATAAGKAMTSALQTARRGDRIAPGAQLAKAEIQQIRTSGLAIHCHAGWCSLAACVSDPGVPLGTLTVAGKCTEIHRAGPQLTALLTRIAQRVG